MYVFDLTSDLIKRSAIHIDANSILIHCIFANEFHLSVFSVLVSDDKSVVETNEFFWEYNFNWNKSNNSISIYRSYRAFHFWNVY